MFKDFAAGGFDGDFFTGKPLKISPKLVKFLIFLSKLHFGGG
jgi:hypothetical protein